MQPVSNRSTLDKLYRPLNDLRISVMDRCNFRCTYCMPHSTFHQHYQFLKSSERLSFTEITRLTRLFVALGVSKLRLTGGEPLLRVNLPDLIKQLHAIESVEDIALTTNGTLLEQYADELQAAGLKRITVSLDSLNPEALIRMNGGFNELKRVLAGIERAIKAGLQPIKINTVVKKGVNDHTLLDLVDYFRGTGVVVRFIEYMDVGNRNQWHIQHVVPSQEILQLIRARWPVQRLASNSEGEVAERYAFDDGAGEIGFISSVTKPFCSNCNRARLSSEGIFYTCLFSTQGLDLRTPLRQGASDDELKKMIHTAWLNRADRYSEARSSITSENKQRKIEMYYIGG